jgi:hypothetical protein
LTSTGELRRWEAHIRELARLPNVFCKLPDWRPKPIGKAGSENTDGLEPSRNAIGRNQASPDSPLSRCFTQDCAISLDPSPSAAGTPSETGVILMEVPDTSDAAKAGFLAGDVLLAFNGKPIKELKDLLPDSRQNVGGKAASVTILRFQQEFTIMIMLKP